MLASHSLISTDAQSIVEVNAFGAGANAKPTNSLVSNTNVDAQAGSAIRTRLLEVRADAPFSPTYSATAKQEGFALIRVGGNDPKRYVTLSRIIDFNASVLMLGPQSPELVVDAAGNITKQVNVTVSQLTPVIKVADIINTGLSSGTLIFAVAPSVLDSLTQQQINDKTYGDTVSATAKIRGNPDFGFSTGFDKVTITNDSTRNLRSTRSRPRTPRASRARTSRSTSRTRRSSTSPPPSPTARRQSPSAIPARPAHRRSCSRA
jgi:hypothetical protein